MQKFIPQIIFLISVMLISSCCKDRSLSNPLCYEDIEQHYFTPSVNNELLDYTGLCQSPIGWQFVYPGHHQAFNPCFNPNNSNQICYLQYDSLHNRQQGYELWTFDFCSEQKQLLTWGVFDIGSPRWSKKNWIVFTGIDYQIWKIKSNGDSLTRLTDNPVVQGYPVWNEDGSKMIYLKNQQNVIADEQATVIDTIIGGQAFSWIDNTHIAFSIGGGNPVLGYIGTYDVISKVKTTLFSYSMPDASSLPVAAIYNKRTNSIFWNSPVGINIFSLATNQNTEIKKGGENRKYSYFDVSPNGKTILTTRVDDLILETCLRGETFSIHAMEADGNNERKLAVEP